MFEKALRGSFKYWAWLAFLGFVAAGGMGAYLIQFKEGLGVTGMSRDVTWGFYIAQFTFLVGVAAGAVMVVLPYYLHNYKAFAKIAILGEFLAVAAVSMCMLFLFVDLGQPLRAMNLILYATPGSVMFWDMIALSGYLTLNIVVGWTTLECERKGASPPRWVKPVIYLSIPWAFSIHTVTAFLYCGLPGRHFWLTAIMAPRFLASAFAAGPALLILLCLIVRKVSTFDPGKKAIQSLAVIVCYAMIANIFFILLEVFTAFYSQIPGHMHSLEYLYFGLREDGVLYNRLVPWMWASTIFSLVAITFLIIPKIRKNEAVLALACVLVFAACWIDKGLGLVIAGFIPSPLGHIVEYTPSAIEIMVTVGIYAIGFGILSVLYKIALMVRGAVKSA